ncbi:cytochrome c [Terasakiella sp. SH-1]|uniref:c-type cytochrome n=1 Tax=Terasakiella sp. SH-1 TaxID=2560057 RepID=UPI001073840F|nr:cytochrome c [Terasakiella sp. SH-1]
MFRKTILTTFFILGLFTAFQAHAHDGATGVVKERMDLMKVIGKNTKAIAPIAMGAADMDLKAVEKGAMAISRAAKLVVDKFPKGSISMVSEAKENIWTNWEEFSGQLNMMAIDANNLAKLAQDQEEFELLEAFEKLVAGCKKCHREYRQK